MIKNVFAKKNYRILLSLLHLTGRYHSRIKVVNQSNYISFDQSKILYSNHIASDDTFVIHLALNEYNKNQNGKIIRTVMADDIFLPDGNRFDFQKNMLLNCLGELSGQILMKRIESTNKAWRKPTTRSIIDALSEGDDVLIYPMGCMSIDGMIDFKKPDCNRIFDDRAYQKIKKGFSDFNAIALHHIYDPVTNIDVLTFLDTNSPQRFDYVQGLCSCTTLTPVSIFSLYSQRMINKNFEEKLRLFHKYYTSIKDEISNLGISTFEGGYTADPPTEIEMHYRLEQNENYSKILRFGSEYKRSDDLKYQYNQIRHLGLEAKLGQMLGMMEK